MGNVIGFAMNKKIYYTLALETFENTKNIINNCIIQNVMPKLKKDNKYINLFKEFLYTNEWAIKDNSTLTLYFYNETNGDSDEISIDLLDYI